MEAPLATEKATICKVLPGLDTTQVMTDHSLHLLSFLYADYSLYEMCVHSFKSMGSAV